MNPLPVGDSSELVTISHLGQNHREMAKIFSKAVSHWSVSQWSLHTLVLFLNEKKINKKK